MSDQKIELLDLFNSFQGEFPYQGRYSTFVRFPKCNLKCKWCDTLNPNNKTMIFDYKDILDKVLKTNFITFTGGEPSLYIEEIIDILTYLVDKNIYFSNVTFETNGVELDKFKNIFNSLNMLGLDSYNFTRIIWSPKLYSNRLKDIALVNLYDYFNPFYTYIKIVSVPEDEPYIRQFIETTIQTYGNKIKRNIALMFFTDKNGQYDQDNMIKTMNLSEEYGIGISTRIQLELNIK
jgi:organic radical activating enzyme